MQKIDFYFCIATSQGHVSNARNRTTPLSLSPSYSPPSLTHEMNYWVVLGGDSPLVLKENGV